jgi:hypothetical protein
MKLAIKILMIITLCVSIASCHTIFTPRAFYLNRIRASAFDQTTSFVSGRNHLIFFSSGIYLQYNRSFSTVEELQQQLQQFDYENIYEELGTDFYHDVYWGLYHLENNTLFLETKERVNLFPPYRETCVWQGYINEDNKSIFMFPGPMDCASAAVVFYSHSSHGREFIRTPHLDSVDIDETKSYLYKQRHSQ